MEGNMDRGKEGESRAENHDEQDPSTNAGPGSAQDKPAKQSLLPLVECVDVGEFHAAIQSAPLEKFIESAIKMMGVMLEEVRDIPQSKHDRLHEMINGLLEIGSNKAKIEFAKAIMSSDTTVQVRQPGKTEHDGGDDTEKEHRQVEEDPVAEEECDFYGNFSDDDARDFDDGEFSDENDGGNYYDEGGYDPY